MSKKYSAKLSEAVEEMGFEILHKSDNYDKARVRTAALNRPALQLSGFYTYFDPERIQVIGRVESTYLESLTEEGRYKAFEELMRYEIAALVLCHGVQPFPECVKLAKMYDRNLFITSEDTTSVVANLIGYLSYEMAPRQTIHGVLVEVYGEGLLITGDSGIGKSETALELIKRGHRLIADDAVEIRCARRNTLTGTAPELIRHYMELRGIGLVDVRHLYGVGAVKPETSIDLRVHFEHWDKNSVYDRLGIDTEFMDILGVKIPSLTIPVMAGRNLAVILELAAMNNRQKKMGFNAAQILADMHDSMIDERAGMV